jgi:iron complex outermembrane receptor protein
MRNDRWHSCFKIGLCLGAALLLPVSVEARAPAISHYDLPTQPLGEALRQVARQSGTQIMFSSDQVVGLSAPGLVGDLGVRAAIDRLIAGTGLAVEESGGTFVIRGRSEPPRAAVAGTAEEQSDIVVTGSRIRGAIVASPVISLSREEIARAGQSNLGDAVRSLPQSFGGGQNPGVGMGAGGSPDNENVGSGSTIDLRGIGEDATLTLLNGHRVAYNVSAQDIDVSSIPLAAVDRLEIVADGASALYGSDAVGGVANIILRKDFDGVWTSARLGGATDGGDRQQQYSVVAGTRWSGGGIIATYDFGRDTPVDAGQRSYTRPLNPSETLLPFEKHHSALLSGHENILPGLSFSIDGSFNERWSNYTTPVNPTGSYLDYGLLGSSRSISYSVAPSLRYTFARDWTATLLGVYAADRTHYGSDLYLDGADISPTRGCYCNIFKNLEFNVEGPLAQLPGGAARLAAGGGYRTNGLHAYRTAGGEQDVDVHQGTYYGFAELYLPLVSEAQKIPALSSLSLNGAFRYEDYPGVARVATPKVGLVYSPIAGLELKGSWGQSFKAPTLYQQYAVQYSALYPASALGGTSYPANGTAILLSGANPTLKPEHATTWTITAALAPPAWSGFHAEISYFNIRYRNRVVAPITSSSAALANPAYSGLVNTDPSAADIEGVTSGSTYAFDNYTGGPLDPSNMVAIIDNRYRNIARQMIHGVDVSLRYRLALAPSSAFTIVGNATYLDSAQRFGPGQPAADLAGTIFYPPHFRSRGGLVWEGGPVTLTSYVNYTGGVRDNRTPEAVHVGGMATLDVSAQYRFDGSAGLLSNVDILFSVQNVANDKPSIIHTTANYFLPYDSTNYSAVGRFLSLTISKHW